MVDDSCFELAPLQVKIYNKNTQVAEVPVYEGKWQVPDLPLVPGKHELQAKCGEVESTFFNVEVVAVVTPVRRWDFTTSVEDWIVDGAEWARDWERFQERDCISLTRRSGTDEVKMYTVVERLPAGKLCQFKAMVYSTFDTDKYKFRVDNKGEPSEFVIIDKGVWYEVSIDFVASASDVFTIETPAGGAAQQGTIRFDYIVISDLGVLP